ncbi:UDP-glucose--hexose-1-phosphate uridylyltransferase [Agrilactobacillus yilanensis]|uniref:Galactose-1-phosphate uridylyltransferase n=1 Tax=Agrilactobacillus yilanensis TaxID=2485997 RepID=A0ABW4JD20_9LACO|nr:UDP-glucose--hexose-1-phosphate uridylyltransferase [Agrilactobacillus yilanensis]
MATDLAQGFAQQIIATKQTFAPLDQIYLTNLIYRLVGEENLTVAQLPDEILTTAANLVTAAVKNQKIADTVSDREILEAQLTDLFTPTPTAINETFWQYYQISPKTATDYFFNLSQANDYIKTKAIAKNISYKTPTEYGDLEITVNLSRPEKDPKAIAAAKSVPETNYPKCQLCLENEGYTGRANYPARANHRVIRLRLSGESWGLQYSPYAYFSEHCIFLSAKHEPMHIDQKTFTKLFEIVKLFPDYFVGSNADLPIVGGSMLTHDHYQGGRHDFPMAKAALRQTFTLPAYPEIQAGIVDWPMSVIRLQSQDIEALINCSTHILKVWQTYSDPTVTVFGVVDGVLHHTITPIVRQKAGQYTIDLVLRDNQTSKAHPLGIFHPHEDVQHIKKENIGLIEVMGRAILPARLKTELQEVARYLLDQPNTMKAYHQVWADALKAQHTFTTENVETILNQEVGLVFKRVLEDAGVFKNDATGRSAFERFLKVI